MTLSSLLRDMRLREGGLSAVPESTQPVFFYPEPQEADLCRGAEGIAGAAALCIRVPGSRRMSHQCPPLDSVVLTNTPRSNYRIYTVLNTLTLTVHLLRLLHTSCLSRYLHLTGCLRELTMAEN